jgi:glucose 1-dehydrogenase
VLVNNAGIEKSQPLLEIDEASWDRTLAVDLKGPFLCLQAAARRMKDSGGGSIVNISSIHEDFGAIATPINAATLADPAKVQRLQEIVPLQRMGTPEEVAEVALFLASGRSSYVTGSTYFVDGGIVRHAEAL